MNDNFDLIDKFFCGVMDQDELAEFERRRLVDKTLEKDILLYQQANELVRAGARKRMKQHLDELGQKEFANTMVETYMKYRVFKSYWYAVAASVLVLIGLSYFAFLTIRSDRSVPTLAQVFDDYYEVPKTDLMILRGDNSDGTLSIVWNSALLDYSEGRLTDAMKGIKVVLSDSGFTHRSAAHFYMGSCFLQMNLPDSAGACFSRVSPFSSLSQDADWYLGLSYLKGGNRQKAAEVFETIAKSKKHYKKEQASAILKIMKRIE